MSKFKRLSEKERKIQICNAAKDVFLKKGFSRSNMEDVIEASGISKGGVYNYYKNLCDDVDVRLQFEQRGQGRRQIGRASCRERV